MPIKEIDDSINFKKLRRAMKTFIIMDKGFMKNLSAVLKAPEFLPRKILIF